MFNKAADWGMGLLVVAGIFVLVRPKSQGPALVTNLTSGVASMVNSATGGGGWS